jgi:hypothetical protein
MLKDKLTEASKRVSLSDGRFESIYIILDSNDSTNDRCKSTLEEKVFAVIPLVVPLPLTVSLICFIHPMISREMLKSQIFHWKPIFFVRDQQYWYPPLGPPFFLPNDVLYQQITPVIFSSQNGTARC